MICRCGCGRSFAPSRHTLRRLAQGRPVGYAPGCRPRGPTHYHWQGGNRQHGEYRQLWMPDHPDAMKSGYVYEHRKVAADKIGRLLHLGESVHHINGNKSDNRPENLDVLQDAEHKSLHSAGPIHPAWNEQLSIPKTCGVCGKLFVPPRNSYQSYCRAKVCSIACRRIGNSGEKNLTAKVSDAVVEEIRALKGQLTQRAIAKKFGLSKTWVGRLLRGEARPVG
jgi:hypothetical protein